MRRFGLVVGLVAGLAPLVGAQRPDSVRADSARGDTTDYSALFLKSYEEGRVRVPILPRLGRHELLPPLTRRVFDRDSVEWNYAETLSDLLSKVPGVFVWRGGWVGRPEPINYQARGSNSVEFVVDGVPYLPLGPDSVAVDPSIIPLTFFDRVEVERLPGQLRVFLYSRRHDRLPARTRVGVSAGDFDIARYIASLEKRSANGFGYVVAAEHLAVPLRSGQQGGYGNTQAWLQASYVGKGPVSASLQVFRGGPNRKDVLDAAKKDTLSQGLLGRRTDFQAALSYAPGKNGLGLRATALAGYSAWREDSTALTILPDRHVRYLDQSVWHLGGQVGVRSPVMSFDGQAWYRSRWTPVEARAAIGLTPIVPFSASAEGVYQRHDGGRTSQWLTARAALALPLRFRAVVQGRSGSYVEHPMMTLEPARQHTDWAGIASFEHPRLAAEVGYWHTDGYSPLGFPLYRTIDSIGPSGPTNWLTVSGRVAPRQWFILDGWYSNPLGSRPEGVPPTHGIVNATIQSKFLPTFRSGIFVLKLQGTMESWGAGVIGRDAKGQAIPLKGATIFRALLEIKIGEFVAYYDRANFQGTDLGYLPGLPIFKFASSFGIRWEFTN